MRLDIESYWEYDDPGSSEARFRRLVASLEGDDRLEVLTQIARTYGLRERFEQAHALLDDVERELEGAGLRPRVRYLLERGRTLNSSGERQRARELFVDAWEAAEAAGLEGMAVDAAHMVAITFAGEPEATEWSRRGLEIGRASNDPKAQALIPALLNNSAWDLFDQERYEEALPYFERALEAWAARGKRGQTLVARWSVARCLRAIGRNTAALDQLRDLEAEHRAAGTADGFVFEEIGENLAQLGQPQEAASYFAMAYELLSADEQFAAQERERLAGLKARAGGA